MKKITLDFALAVLSLFLLSGCGGSDAEFDEKEKMKSSYESDFKWAVDQMEEVYDDYDIKTGAWRLLDVEDVYITSANEMNGADYAVVMIVEFAKKLPGDKEWVDGTEYTFKEGEFLGKSTHCGDIDKSYKPAQPIKFQVASWDGDRQLACLTAFKDRMAEWASWRQ